MMFTDARGIRPERVAIRDSMGRLRTLASGGAAFDRIAPRRPGGEGASLFLGLGPYPDEAASLAREQPSPSSGACPGTCPGAVAFVECPGFIEEMTRCRGEAYTRSLERRQREWRRLAPEEVEAFFDDHGPELWRYRQGLRLFPEFWGPLQACLRVRALPAGPGADSGERLAVLLPGGPGDLLHRELTLALRELGLRVLSPESSLYSGEDPRGLTRGAGGDWRDDDLLEIVRREKPRLMLSVNMRGLDRGGERYHLLRAMGVAVALWFVDNPWHILSALRQPWWREAHLFVTDATFLPQLARHGAKSVHHLPLASSPCFDPYAEEGGARLPSGTRLLFVGRSAFPGRDKYFAAVSGKGGNEGDGEKGRFRDGALMDEAYAMLMRGESPDFHWWTERCRLTRLWPGPEARVPGWGAERASLHRRALWLRASAACGLCVVGDEAWKDMLPPDPVILPPVDYYRDLPGLYAAAPYTLNVTSLLLPGGLTQRHFDVWRAGGFLLTNRNAGLNIFPPRLVEAISLDRAEDAAARMRELDGDAGKKEELREEWRQLVCGEHDYTIRMKRVLACAGAGA